MLRAGQALSSSVSRETHRRDWRPAIRSPLITICPKARRRPFSSRGTVNEAPPSPRKLYKFLKATVRASTCSSTRTVARNGHYFGLAHHRISKSFAKSRTTTSESGSTIGFPSFSLGFFTHQRRWNSSDSQNQQSSSSSSSSHKSEKYSEFLWRRLGVWRQSFRKFFGAGQPFTLDKFLPVFNLMFVAIATTVLIGTTSIISLIVWIVNRNERWRELFAEHVSKTLTYQTGIDITFEKAQGSWKEGLIKLHRVKVVRDPKTFEPGRSRNVTAMSLDIDEVAAKVSLLWFLQGKGWLKELNATGVKGTIDQRHLDWSGPPAPRRKWKRGDLFLDAMQLTNVELSLFKPNPDRELKITLHLLNCPKLRQQFLLYDILSAKSAYGIFDGSLFSLKHTYSDDDRTRSLLKIDGIKTDIITSSAVGPLSWITEGTMDLEAELLFDADEADDGYENYYRNDQNVAGVAYHLEPSEPLAFKTTLKLNNLRASMPVTPPELSLISYALVRPVVAYMNTNYTSIPLNFDVYLDKRNFDGAWSPYEAGLFDAMSIAVAKEFLELMKEQKRPANIPRHLVHVIKSVQRGISFVLSQMHGYYELWYFNNDDHHFDHSFSHIRPPKYIAAATAAAAAVELH